MGIGLNIKNILRREKKSIKWLHEVTGIPLNTLYNITKKNNINVNRDTVQKIADCLNVSIDEILKPTLTLESNKNYIVHPSQAVISPLLSEFTLSDWIMLAEKKDFGKQMAQRAEDLEKFYQDSIRNSIPQGVIDSIIGRRKQEDELLKLFFELNPRNRTQAVQTLQQLYYNQIALEKQKMTAVESSQDSNNQTTNCTEKE